MNFKGTDYRHSSFRERLKEAMDLRKMTQADLARCTGLNKGGISNYVTGRYEPKEDIIKKLALALNCSEAWLRGYDVPMRPKQEKIYSYDDYNACISDEEDPARLELEEYLDTLTPGEIRTELERFKTMDKNDSPDEPKLTEGEKTLLEAFRKLTPKNQEIALQMILGALEAMQ